MTKIPPQILLTFITLERNKQQSLGRQLYTQLRNALLGGMLRPGDRLPSTRDLAVELGIARNTVLHVFEQLLIEGFLSGKTGSGTFVSEGLRNLSRRSAAAIPPPEPALRQIKRPLGLNEAFGGHESSLEEIRPFQISVPLVSSFPFDTWTRLANAVHRDLHRLHLGYDDAQGYLPLREALAAHLRISRSIHCEAENILITHGSRQAIHLAAELLIGPGDACWMEEPGYNGAKSAIQRFGGKTCAIPVGEHGMDLDYAIAHYPGAKLAYVTPSHQFPLGSTLSLDARVRLLNYAAAQGMWIIEDDYDSEFRYNSRPLPALQGLDTAGNVVYLGSLSKVLFPALRLGYLVLPNRELARAFTIAKSAIDGQCNIASQAIAAQFIAGGHFSRHIRKMKLRYKSAQDELVSLLGRHLPGLVKPVPAEAGMHLVAWLHPDLDAEFLSAKAQAQGMVLHSLQRYSLGPAGNAVVLGFSGFTKKELEHGVLELKSLISDFYPLVPESEKERAQVRSPG
ncbi:MocR-like pyridoxine biosynthesis transcription factor PdxR [Pedobacter yulinensis]|nr:PLP-dependent aminotransferase family protein [Pedobacter yulinensis]